MVIFRGGGINDVWWILSFKSTLAPFSLPHCSSLVLTLNIKHSYNEIHTSGCKQVRITSLDLHWPYFPFK